MPSLPRILLLALALLAFSAQATAAMLPPTAIDCAGCPEGGADEHASDFHDHCTCSSHAPRLVNPASEQCNPPQSEDQRFLQLAELAPASPDPNPIQHVPKR